MLHEAIHDYILKHAPEIEAEAKKSERYSDAAYLWLYVQLRDGRRLKVDTISAAALRTRA